MEQHKVSIHLLIANQKLLPSRQKKGITIAHLPQHLQLFITTHKSGLHPNTPENIYKITCTKNYFSHLDQVFVIHFVHILQYGHAIG